MTTSTAAILGVLAILPAVLWWVMRRRRAPRALETGEIRLYRVPCIPPRQIGIVTGDLRRVRCARVWVNPENTAMRMSRVEELSVSAIIRYEGARRDDAGRVVVDLIADELSRRVGARRPVPAGAVFITGAGELARFGVRYVAHSAAVEGQPGGGFRQVREVGRCVTAVLAAIDELPKPVESVLFPLLGAGQGGADPVATAHAIVGAAVDYLVATPASAIGAVYLLAYTDAELAACRRACHRRSLRPVRNGSVSSAPLPVAASDPAPSVEPLAHKTLQVGFSVDVVGFGSRSTGGREAVEQRLLALLSQILADVGTSLDRVAYQWLGDGASVYLPSDVDPSGMVTGLVEATTRRLAEDNEAHPDRLRLRLAVTVGLLGQGVAGYTGPIVVDLARMVDAPALRQAIIQAPQADLAVLLSDSVYRHVVRPDYTEASATPFRQVEIVVKEFAAPGWLWLPEDGREVNAGWADA